MKKILVILLSIILFMGCNNVQTEKAEVTSDPVTSSLMVHNKTDMDIYVNCSFCVDKVNDTTLVKKDSSYLIQSNNKSSQGTIFTIGIPHLSFVLESISQ